MYLLPAFKQLDLFRLHDVIRKIERGQLIGRGEGQTVARAYLMLGELELGDTNARYLYVGENSLCTKWFAREFHVLVGELFPEMKGTIDSRSDWSPDTIVVPNGQVYRFMCAERMVQNSAEALRGQRFDKVFFDVSWVMQDDLDREGRLTEAMIILQENGAEFV
jgi:hypothetical protein